MSGHTVVLADDHPLFREGVARTLEESGRFRVLGLAGRGSEAVALAASLRPDLVLLDLSMPDGGLWALERIAGTGPVVAMLTVNEDSEMVFSALEKGAIGYVLKGVSGRELVALLEGLMEGQSYIAPALAARVLTRLRAPRAEADPIDSLTRREEEILRLVAEGLSNKEVARRLVLQERTVKHHMTQVLQKLHLRNRTEAALAARRRWGDG